MKAEVGAGGCFLGRKGSGSAGKKQFRENLKMREGQTPISVFTSSKRRLNEAITKYLQRDRTILCIFLHSSNAEETITNLFTGQVKSEDNKLGQARCGSLTVKIPP